VGLWTAVFAILSFFPSLQANLRGQDRAAGAGVGGYLGFDQNSYPGDDRLAVLHHSLAYTGYWLNTPPGAQNNSWAGKRAVLRSQGFGFLILYNGLLDAELAGKDAAALGRRDAAAAIAAAGKADFPARAIIFLDQEEGGRLLPEQSAYLFAWVDGIRKSRFRPGVYCSGIAVRDGATSITTAGDILNHAGDRHIALWVFNDGCPPSPGCALPPKSLSPSASGIPQALVWQYARSPRTQFAQGCAATYAPDSNCYAPGMPRDARSFLDLDLSNSADPSSGR
jgi:hypothetical protein